MKHETYLEWISADLDGQLSPAQQKQLKTHLHACPSCARRYWELSQNSHRMRNLDCEVPPQLRETILANLPAQARPRFPRKALAAVSSLAACLVLVFALSYMAHAPAPPTTSRVQPATTAFSVQPRGVDAPGGDQVLLLDSPLPSSAYELLEQHPVTTLDDGSACCVVDGDTARSLMEWLDESQQTYTYTAASTPDGSGNTAVIWPQS